jgi:hypothetical protein
MKQIFVDSRDRTSGTSSNFTISLPHTLSLTSGHQGRIDDFRLPITTGTVYEGNDSIRVLMSGQTYQVVLEWGQYGTGNDLANEIRSKLAAGVPGNWTVTYSVWRTSMTITCSNSFQFVGGTFMNRLLARNPYWDGMGTYIFPYVPLQGLDMCYLCCSDFALHDSCVGPKGACDVLCAIPINIPYGSVQVYGMCQSVFFDLPAVTTQTLSFQLRDRDFNILSIVPNISFTLTID